MLVLNVNASIDFNLFKKSIVAYSHFNILNFFSTFNNNISYKYIVDYPLSLISPTGNLSKGFKHIGIFYTKTLYVNKFRVKYIIATTNMTVKDKLNIVYNNTSVNTSNKGVITHLDGGFCVVQGLSNALYGEWVVVAAKNGCVLLDGMVIGIDSTSCTIAILGDYTICAVKDYVKKTEKLMGFEFNIQKTLGRVIDAVGGYLIAENQNNEQIRYTLRLELEVDAPGIIDRSSVKTPLQTGIISIDSMIPLGRGQRELILGDKQTGKTMIAIDTILNQKYTMCSTLGLICIYVSIGQRAASIKRIHSLLRKKSSMAYSVIVATTASDAVSLQYLAPYTGCVIGEWFRDIGEDSLVVYDDLSKHAVAYRQMTLLLRRPPCRDAYPADIFFIHSRLLERAAQMSSERGGGSLTALPIVETLLGDVAAYIPTNLISITDGQIFLDNNIFNTGIRPAINIGLSISRVGAAAQVTLLKQIASKFKSQLLKYTSAKHLLSFEGDLTEGTIKTLIRGDSVSRAIYQFKYKTLQLSKQIFLIYTVVMGFFDLMCVTKKNYVFESITRFFDLEPGMSDILSVYNNKDYSVCQYFSDTLLHEI